MTWGYVAGMFDGDGSIRIRIDGKSRSIFNVCLTQSGEKGKQMLLTAKDFFAQHGIVSSLYGPQKSKFSKNPGFQLQLNSLSHKLKFLEGVAPYLTVKRIISEDILRFCKIYRPCFRRSF